MPDTRDPGGLAAPLAAMALVQALTMMSCVAVPVLAPALAADLGIDASLVGVYQSCVFAGAAFLTVLSGSLVRRYGGVRVNQASLLIAGTGLAMTLLGWLAPLTLGALLVGMAYGLATPAASHVLARLAPAGRRGLIFSVKQSAVPLGGLMAGVLLPPIAALAGWPAAVLAALALTLVAVPAIQPIRDRTDADRDPAHRVSLGASWDAIRLVLTTPRLRPLALVAFSFAAMQLSVFAFMVTFLVERVGLALVTAGLVFAAMQASGVVARILWGWVSDHLVPARVLLGLLGCGTVGFTLAAAGLGESSPMSAVVAVALGLGTTVVGWNGIYLAEVAHSVPGQDVAAATGGTLLFTFVGVVLGPAAFTWLVAVSGYALAFLVLDGMIVVTVLSLLWPRRRGRGRLRQPRPGG